MQDITERKRAEESLRQSEQRMTRVLDSASDGMLIVDQAGVVLMANPAAERIPGLPATTLTGTSVRDLPRLVHGHDDPNCAISKLIDQALVDGQATQGFEMAFTRTDGATVHGVIDVVQLYGTSGEHDGLLLTVHDVTERKLLEQQLAQLALHDALTGLPNRRLFEDRAEQALAAARRGGWLVGLLLIDLDNFKPVNDRFGHTAGDEVLVEVARRLSGCLRSEDTAARFGGDEFVVLLRAVRGLGGIREVRERLSRELELPYLVDGQAVTVTASIGTSLTTTADDRLSDLLHHADSSMYAIKSERRQTSARTSYQLV
jgi:diguanylate cyclase (GGDEF)-like protein/PAS domain S-box-containing protein